MMRPGARSLAATIVCGALLALSGAALAADILVPTEVSLKWVETREKFKGTVVSTEFDFQQPGCVDQRQVVVKRKQEGQDKVINRDLTDEEGKYQMGNFTLKEKYHTGRFYARVVPVEIEDPDGLIVKCRAARSETIRVE